MLRAGVFGLGGAWIRGVGLALPPNYYDQETLIAALRPHWATRHVNLDRLELLHKNALVGGRHLALPMEAYPALAMSMVIVWLS